MEFTFINNTPGRQTVSVREHLESMEAGWDESTPLVNAEYEEYDVNISSHPVYKNRFAGTPQRSQYINYIHELLDTRGMRERDLRNLCGKRLGIRDGDIHGEVLKGEILAAMKRRERFLINAAVHNLPDPEICLLYTSPSPRD